MKFLVSDDNPFLRAAIKKVLFRNYPTAFIEEVKAGSALLANACNKEYHWDLIISTIGNTGLAAMEIIEALQKTKHIPILILSAVKLEDYANFGFLDRISGFILTDNFTEVLPKTINRILSQGVYSIEQTKIAC